MACARAGRALHKPGALQDAQAVCICAFHAADIQNTCTAARSTQKPRVCKALHQLIQLLGGDSAQCMHGCMFVRVMTSKPARATCYKRRTVLLFNETHASNRAACTLGKSHEQCNVSMATQPHIQLLSSTCRLTVPDGISSARKRYDNNKLKHAQHAGPQSPNPKQHQS